MNDTASTEGMLSVEVSSQLQNRALKTERKTFFGAINA